MKDEAQTKRIRILQELCDELRDHGARITVVQLQWAIEESKNRMLTDEYKLGLESRSELKGEAD